MIGGGRETPDMIVANSVQEMAVAASHPGIEDEDRLAPSTIIEKAKFFG